MDAHAVAIAALSQFANHSNHALEVTGDDLVDDRPNNGSAATRPNATPPPAQEQSHSLTKTRANKETQPILTSSNTSQTTNADSHTSQNTPPTSDGFSSQDYEAQLSQSTKAAAAKKSREPISPVQQLLSSGNKAGQKRTASGTVKPSGRVSPGRSPESRHTRNQSVVSNASSAASTRIGEVIVHSLFPLVALISSDKHMPNLPGYLTTRNI